MDFDGKYHLAELLTELCKVDGIEWIRILYAYKDRITDELIDVMAREEKICNYLDIPLQHASDSVLRAMDRRSTHTSIKRTLRKLRAAIDDIHIRTTLIVGFPGETEEDFDELLEFVEGMCLERLGVFAYSREEGTPAGDREDQIDDEIKVARADAVMRRQLDISREINEEKLGCIMEVMVEDIDEEGAYIARTQYDAPEIDNTVIFKSDRELVPGDFVKVTITDAFDYDLVGRVEE
jgi:ribosomal protein S12 methylthiotransferase